MKDLRNKKFVGLTIGFSSIVDSNFSKTVDFLTVLLQYLSSLQINSFHSKLYNK